MKSCNFDVKTTVVKIRSFYYSKIQCAFLSIKANIVGFVKQHFLMRTSEKST